MAVFTNLTQSDPSLQPLVTDFGLQISWMVFKECLGPVSIAFGLCANAINMAVFWKMGLSDGVTLSLFYLALSDFLYMLVHAVVSLWQVTDRFPRTRLLNVSHKEIGNFCFYYSLVFQDVAMLITVYISIARACCVVIPLKFKNIFTKRTTNAVCFALFCLILALRVPLLTANGLHWTFNHERNMTILGIHYKSHHDAARTIHVVISRNILRWSSFALVIISLIVLTVKMKSSAKFRQKSTAGQTSHNNGQRQRSDWSVHHDSNTNKQNSGFNFTSNQPNIHRRQDLSNKETEPEGWTTTSKLGSTTLTGKDRLVVKVVMLLALIFITFNSLSLCLAFVERFAPVSGRIYNLLFMMGHVGTQFGLLNAGVNIFVYYNYNSKFRATVKTVMKIECLKKEESVSS